MKIQRFLVEVERVFDPAEGDLPLTQPYDIHDWVVEEVHHDNFSVCKNVVEDYKGTDRKSYNPLWCLPKGCEECTDRIDCLIRATTLKGGKDYE